MRGEPFEAVDVDVLGVDGQAVPGGGELDEAVGRAAVLQAPAQPRDLRLEGFGGALGRVLAVQAVDEPFGAHDPPGIEGEQGQQPPQLRPAEGDRGPVGTVGFDRPEDRELHRAILAHHLAQVPVIRTDRAPASRNSSSRPASVSISARSPAVSRSWAVTSRASACSRQSAR